MPKGGKTPDNLYERNGTWYVRFEVRGREVRRSLRTSVLAEAKKRRDKLKAEAEHFRFHGEDRKSWKDAVLAWTESGPEIAAGTMKRYLVSLGQVRGILDDLYLDQITTRTIARIANRSGVTNATRRRDLTAVSVVLRWCVSQEWIEINPARSWDRSVIKERRDPIALPTPYDIDCAVAAAPGNFARLIRFAQYTGMREEECASLEHNEISSQRRAAQLSKTKTNRPRAVALDERALGTLSGTPINMRTRYVFWHGAGDRYANVSSRFGEIMRRAVAAAKSESRPVPRRFRFHDLRHWYAVDDLRRGNSIYTLQQQLGHSSIKTTELYLAFLTPAEQDAAKRGSAQE